MPSEGQVMMIGRISIDTSIKLQIESTSASLDGRVEKSLEATPYR
jgi:hypothetical protein